MGRMDRDKIDLKTTHPLHHLRLHQTILMMRDYELELENDPIHRLFPEVHINPDCAIERC